MKKQVNKTSTENNLVNKDEQDNNITQQEIQLLDTAGEDEEEHELNEAVVDNTDDDGDPLNENLSGDISSGGELDVPGSEEDDDDEEPGEEDEENNSYTLAGEKKD